MNRLTYPLAFLLASACVAQDLSRPLAERELPELAYVVREKGGAGQTVRVQEPLTPEQSRLRMVVPPGFDVELFAAEPDIVNPVALAWDERGRCFVAESVDYPHAPERGQDRITICEDTDGDGRADRFTRFAEGLSIVTGLTFARGGVIVAQAPDMLYLADTDGDDRADVREVLFSGWGTWDTHAGPSNLAYGLDGWVWGAVGYSGFEAEFEGGTEKLSMGLYRFTPDGEQFEAVATFDNNTWGLGLSPDFEVFGSTANNNHSIHVGIPFRHSDAVAMRRERSPTIQGHYDVKPLTKDVQQVDVRGGFTAAAGHRIVGGDGLPERWRGRMGLVNEPTAHLVHLARLEEAGGSFREVDGGNLLASDDAWVAPVYSEVGPDGSVWVCDWYNPVIQHNPDRRSADNQIWNDEKGPGNAHVNPLRDTAHGRIWRVIDRRAEPAEPAEIVADDVESLLAALGHPNPFWRTTATRLLIDAADGEVAFDLALQLGGASSSEEAIHVLWALHGLEVFANDEAGELALEAAVQCLGHADPRVRKNALRVLPATEATAAALADAGLLADADLQVRRDALLKLVELPETSRLADQLLGAALEETARGDRVVARALEIAQARYGGQADRERRVVVPAAESEVLTWQFTLEDPGEGWEAPGFDASSWKRGRAGFGRKGTPGARIGSLWHEPEIWLRLEVDLDEAALNETGDLVARIHHDEDVRVFVNGVPALDLAGYTVEYVDRPLSPEAAAALRPGRNVLAAHCRQTVGGQFIDLGLTRLVTASADEGAGGTGEALRLELAVEVGTMLYDRDRLEAPAGVEIELVMRNPDHMPHNFVLLTSGSLQRFGAATDAFLTNPEAAKQHYVPESKDVLAVVPMLNPGDEFTLRFRAPKKAGDYPYVCTFPGHWRLMNGILRVTEAVRVPEVLLVGGGSSHAFERWVGGEDVRTLRAGGLARARYTEDFSEVATAAADVDLLVLTNNRPPSPESRAAILSRAAAGGAFLLCHAATWFNWRDWPEYNRELVGGGSASHERYGRVEVEIVAPDHPAVAGVPTSFAFDDELYRFVPDDVAGIEVLAVGRSPETEREFPVVWIVKHPTARIVCTTLGHDGASHEHPAYKLLLRASTRWLTGE